jgi:ribulose bisphosphate carboxylase small subunit
MELDINLKKSDVSFADVQTIVQYILGQGYSISNMHIIAG